MIKDKPASLENLKSPSTDTLSITITASGTLEVVLFISFANNKLIAVMATSTKISLGSLR